MSPNSDQAKHILAINDDAAILELFHEILTEEGFRVTTDSFSRQTVDLLELIRETQPDLVLMDFVFGGEIKGWQLLQATRMDRTIRDIPVVICTAAVRQVEELSSHLESMGIQVVIKPFDIDNLINAIERAWKHDSES